VARVTGLATGLLLAVLIGACTPIPEDFGRSPGASGSAGSGTSSSPAAAVSPGVTVEGSTVTIVGVGGTKSDLFELPAGNATMTIDACTSNHVMPFITLTTEGGQSAGLVVDPTKELKNLAGGKYYVQAQTNPDCVWKVTITPA
jgi:hypothetical protein